jgi:hypothetical protein
VLIKLHFVYESGHLHRWAGQAHTRARMAGMFDQTQQHNKTQTSSTFDP